MREIKFRGKRLDDRVWVYGGLITDNKGNYGIAQLVLLNNCVTSAVRLIDPATVGQFTGLLDKGGKEIYEGDIIKTEFSYATWFGHVHFNKGNFELVDSDKNGQYLPLSILSDIEVIINIHDTPELLTE